MADQAATQASRLSGQALTPPQPLLDRQALCRQSRSLLGIQRRPLGLVPYRQKTPRAQSHRTAHSTAGLGGLGSVGRGRVAILGLLLGHG